MEWIKRDCIYYCECGLSIDEEIEYNADTNTFQCLMCGAESPDIENITISE